MKVEEEPLAAELRADLAALRGEVKALRARVVALESDGSGAPTREPEEREGDFGPAIKRSAPVRHQSAVSKALTMIGVLPEEAETKRSPSQTAAHKRAIALMRNMGSEPVAEPEAASTQPAEVFDAAPRVVPDAGSIVPLPEIRGEQDQHREAVLAAHAAAVELDDALAIDLSRERSRACDLLLLLIETVVASTLLALLPAHVGVLAAVAFTLLLCVPDRSVLRAHARFLTLVVAGRCLFPDVWAQALPLQLPALVSAGVPAFGFVFAGRVGWTVQALALGAVAGAIAASQGLSLLHAAGVGVVASGLAWLLRGVGR